MPRRSRRGSPKPSRAPRAEGVTRKALTPFLLKRIFELTEGKSLVSNIALVENNAMVAAKIAVAMAARVAPKPAVRRA